MGTGSHFLIGHGVILCRSRLHPEEITPFLSFTWFQNLLPIQGLALRLNRDSSGYVTEYSSSTRILAYAFSVLSCLMTQTANTFLWILLDASFKLSMELLIAELSRRCPPACLSCQGMSNCSESEVVDHILFSSLVCWAVRGYFSDFFKHKL